MAAAVIYGDVIYEVRAKAQRGNAVTSPRLRGEVASEASG
jgi:hypothetical protein